MANCLELTINANITGVDVQNDPSAGYDMESRGDRYIRYIVTHQQLNPLHLPLHSRYMALQSATSVAGEDEDDDEDPPSLPSSQMPRRTGKLRAGR